MQEGEALTHPWVTKAIENAQRKVEGHNFDIRKQLLEFDDVANDQRRVIYSQRNELMETNDISQLILEIREEVLQEVVMEFIPLHSIEPQWNITGLMQTLDLEFGQKLAVDKWLTTDEHLNEEDLRARIIAHFAQLLQTKEAKIGATNMRYLEKAIMLNVLDSHWKEHLSTMDYMRQSIHLRGYAQKDPKQEYKREAFNLFSSMLGSIRREVIRMLAIMQMEADVNIEAVEEKMRQDRTPQQLEFHHAQTSALATAEAATNAANTADDAVIPEHHTPYVRSTPKVGRNEPCPCGSGRKYKQCHGKIS
jgi:preprotein translocase subunit SecA